MKNKQLFDAYEKLKNEELQKERKLDEVFKKGSDKYKVTTLGQSNSGKTTFIKRITNNRFSSTATAPTTDGSYIRHILKQGEDEFKINFTDTNGTERF